MRLLSLLLVLLLSLGVYAENKTLDVGTVDVPEGYQWDRVEDKNVDAWRGVKGRESVILFAAAPGYEELDEETVEKLLGEMSKGMGLPFSRIRIQESDVPKPGSYKFAFQVSHMLGFGYVYTSRSRRYATLFLGLGIEKPVKEVKHMAVTFQENESYTGFNPRTAVGAFTVLAALALLCSSVRVGCLAAFGYFWIFISFITLIRLVGENSGNAPALTGNLLGFMLMAGLGGWLVKFGNQSRALGGSVSMANLRARPTGHSGALPTGHSGALPTGHSGVLPTSNTATLPSSGPTVTPGGILAVCLGLLLVLGIIGYVNRTPDPELEPESAVAETTHPLENAESYYAAEEYDSAAIWAEKALEEGELAQREDRLKARRILGSSFYKTGEYNAAQEQYQMLSKAEPNNQEYKTTLAALKPLVLEENVELGDAALAEAEDDIDMQRFDPARQKVKEAIALYKTANHQEGIQQANQMFSKIAAESSKVTAIVPVAPKPKKKRYSSYSSKSRSRSTSKRKKTKTSVQGYPTVSKYKKRRSKYRSKRRRSSKKRRSSSRDRGRSSRYR